MYLVNFMNQNPDWQAKLAVAPYRIDVKQDGDYYILKYNMVESDFTRPEVLEARGSIFRKDQDGKWICVCRAMDKFFNFGEACAQTNMIDWSKPVSVQEKVDGSIIKVWCDNGLWHTSTNGTIDAFKAECGDSTYGSVFYSIIEGYTSVRAFFDALDPHFTYWFEMVHPQYNHIVVHYSEPAIYYLGCRDMRTMEERELATSELFYGIRTPRKFEYTSLAECVEAAHQMGVDEEGYVCCAYTQVENGSFLRIKVKGDEYLRLHKIRGNGALTVARVVEMWQNDSLDDFIAYYPEFNGFVNEVMRVLVRLIDIANVAYSSIKGYDERRNFARYANTYLPIIRSYLFARYDGKVQDAKDWYRSFRAKSLAAFLTEASQGGLKEIGVVEDA